MKEYEVKEWSLRTLERLKVGDNEVIFLHILRFYVFNRTTKESKYYRFSRGQYNLILFRIVFPCKTLPVTSVYSHRVLHRQSGSFLCHFSFLFLSFLLPFFYTKLIYFYSSSYLSTLLYKSTYIYTCLIYHPYIFSSTI